MKKISVLMVGICCATQLLAQSELSISTGMAFPAGDFGNSNGGAAKIGLMGDIMYQHLTQDKSKLWVAGMVRFQSYKVDIAKFEQAFPGMQISSTHWDAFSFLAGPVVKFDLTETSSFEPRILLGYMSAKSPSVTVSAGGTSASVNSDNGGAFATMLGASFKFKASAKISFMGGVDYLTANPAFTIAASGINGSEQINQQISSFNVIVGLSFKLN